MSTADRERWDAKYRAGPTPRDPSPFVVSLAPLLPATGRALDVAGGAGRHALWLARRGLDVLLCDVSPVALELARAEAGRAGLRLSTQEVDLERDPLPPGPWELVLCFHFLERGLLRAVPDVLAPGGLFVFVQPTRRNLERHDRPPAQYLLGEGELPRLVPEGLDVLRYEEGWLDEGRHEARLVARRRPAIA